MMKYRLQLSDKYKGSVNLRKLRGKAVGTLKNKITFYSVIITMEMAILASLGVKSLNLAVRATNVISSEMDYDVDKVKYGIFEYPGVYVELEKKYNEMSDSEKSAFVKDVFSRVINSSDEYTEEEKKNIIDKEGELLSKYGYNYYFKNIFNFLILLDSIEIRRNVELKMAAGRYSPSSNIIELENDSSNPHETEHVITGGGFSESYRHFILEAMNSSTDKYYYGMNSYIKSMRMQMLFLSKIIGKDNLMKCYFNGDFDLLRNLLGKRADSLFNLFGKEYDYFMEHFTIDDKLVRKTVDEMMNIYKEKNEEVDSGVEFIYKCCLPNSLYLCDETIFSDVLEYKTCSRFDFIDDTFLNKNLLMQYNLETNNSVMINNFDNKSNSIFKNIAFEKIDFLFCDDIATEIVSSNSPEDYLEGYLRKVGVSNVKFWVYNILNGDCPIAVNIEGFNYDKNNFNEDLRKIYQEKYRYLVENNKIKDIYININVFGNEGNDYLKLERFNYLIKNVLKDSEVDVYKIVNSYYDTVISYKSKFLKRKYLERGNINSEWFGKLVFLFGYDSAYQICESDNINNTLRKKLKNYDCDNLDMKIAIFDILSRERKIKNMDDNDIIFDLVCDKCNNSDNLLVTYCDIVHLGLEDNIDVKNIMKSRGFDLDNYKGMRWNRRDYEDDNSSVITYNKTINLYEYDKDDNVIRVKVPNVFTDYTFYALKSKDKKGEIQLISPRGTIEHGDVREYLFSFDDLKEFRYIKCMGNVEKKNNKEMGIVSMTRNRGR